MPQVRVLTEGPFLGINDQTLGGIEKVLYLYPQDLNMLLIVWIGYLLFPSSNRDFWKGGYILLTMCMFIYLKASSQ
jgi:hypothetical protein